MLKYSYRLNTNSSQEEIEVNDFYISSDLSVISGTTSDKYTFGVGDVLKLTSSYFPNSKMVTVEYADTIKRNGYITYNKTVDIKSTFYKLSDEEESKSYLVKHIELNGDTYYQNINNTMYTSFIVDGNLCTANITATTVTVRDKAYIEDDKVTVNGITYNVIINQDRITFSDIEKNPITQPSDWNLDNVNNNFEYVKKFSIGNTESKIIETNSIRRYGIRPYIVDKGERNYLKYIYQDGIKVGFGVTIENADHVILPLAGTTNNPYSLESYVGAKSSTEVISVNNKDYLFGYDYDYVDAGDIVCITTKAEHLPILIGDILTVFNNNQNYHLILQEDDYNNQYVCLNGIKYHRVKNLCDSVIINGVGHQLTYDGDASSPYVGMIAGCKLDDDTILYFKVKELHTGGKAVKSLTKVNINEGGEVIDAYSMILSGASRQTVYTMANSYIVNNCDGIDIDGYKVKVLSYESDGQAAARSYDYIELNWQQEYRLRVVDTIGSNKFLCELDTDESEYTTQELFTLTESVFDVITQNNAFSVLQTPNTFGNTPLTYRYWLYGAVNPGDATSVYELSDIANNIHLSQTKQHVCIPINLSKNIDNSLSQSNLITNFHYDEVADETVNKLVDMDKDMYVPVIKNITTGALSNVEEMEFNLHFRTRDLETWKIIEDEGTYNISGTTVPKSANNIFSNWFVTDYYPYNAYTNSMAKVYNNTDWLNKVMKQSDLLGCLFFTTDDVKYKVKKLTKSFLRLTYFDSKDPNNQNMLGTSTIYFDCDRYFDTLYSSSSNVSYVKIAQSIDVDRIHTSGNAIEDRVTSNNNGAASVLKEPFTYLSTKNTTKDMMFEPSFGRLDSRITISDRYTNTSSSEGFYSYILKAFANKKVEQTIYMKIEFFHAGVGVKIPMVIATDASKQAIKSWTSENLSKFKEGYPLDEIYDRLYIPINISYSKNRKEFVFNIADDNNFQQSMLDGNKLRFNLFELKIKPQ